MSSYKVDQHRNSQAQYKSRAVLVVFKQFDEILALVERSMLLTCESKSLVAETLIQRRISRELRGALSTDYTEPPDSRTIKQDKV